MGELKEEHGALEIICPNETVMERMEAIIAIARTCEKLANALNSPAFMVTVNGNITANSQYGIKTSKKDL